MVVFGRERSETEVRWGCRLWGPLVLGKLLSFFCPQRENKILCVAGAGIVHAMHLVGCHEDHRHEALLLQLGHV